MPTIQTALLEIAYDDDGPTSGLVVLQLHSWPNDAAYSPRLVQQADRRGRFTEVNTSNRTGLRSGRSARFAVRANAEPDGSE